MQTSIYNKETGLITSQSNPETYVSKIIIYLRENQIFSITDTDHQRRPLLLDYAIDVKTTSITLWYAIYQDYTNVPKEVQKEEYRYMSYRIIYPKYKYEDKFGKIETR